MPPRTNDEIRKMIIGYAQDLAKDFMHHDRKDDENLTLELLTTAIKRRTVTQETIVRAFAEQLTKEWDYST